MRCFILTLPGPSIYLFLTSGIKTWHILQSLQQKTNALILLSDYGAIVLFIYLFICYVCLFDLVFDVYDQQLRLLTVS